MSFGMRAKVAPPTLVQTTWNAIKCEFDGYRELDIVTLRHLKRVPRGQYDENWKCMTRKSFKICSVVFSLHMCLTRNQSYKSST